MNSITYLEDQKDQHGTFGKGKTYYSRLLFYHSETKTTWNKLTQSIQMKAKMNVHSLQQISAPFSFETDF